MIIRINTGKNPAGAVHYNEDKVARGQARTIGILNYPQDNTNGLSVHKKIDCLRLYTIKNERVSSPTLHISLAFHHTEILDDEQLITIGEEYRQEMGYGNQPMLIYRHEDSHYPYHHIVSVSVDDDGKRISDSNSRFRSNAIRKKLEIKYQLVKGEEQDKKLLLNTTFWPD